MGKYANQFPGAVSPTKTGAQLGLAVCVALAHRILATTYVVGNGECSVYSSTFGSWAAYMYATLIVYEAGAFFFLFACHVVDEND